MADFYRGKQVKLIIGYAPGTGYDVHARLLGRHLGRHIPGEPTIVPQNMEGAGSLRAGLYVFNVADKDGLTIGAMNRSMVLAPLLGKLDASQANFDPRQLGWVGSINTATTVGVVWAASGITKFDDLRQKEVIVSSDQTTSDSYVFAQLMNNLLGTKLKVITGYSGTTASYLAMERGETTGYMGTSYSSLKATKPDWIRDKKVNILIQVALEAGPGTARRPDHYVACQVAVGAAGAGIAACPAGHGPALLHDAGCSAGAARRVAEGVHGHHERPRLHCRRSRRWPSISTRWTARTSRPCWRRSTRPRRKPLKRRSAPLPFRSSG